MKDVFKKRGWQENGINIDDINIDMIRLNHLQFADDIVIMANTGKQLKTCIENFIEHYYKLDQPTNKSETTSKEEEERPQLNMSKLEQYL